MNDVKFYLLKRKGNTTKTKTLILLAFNYTGNRLYCPLNMKVMEEEWDSKKQRVKSRVVGSLEINMTLDRLEKEVKSIYMKGLAEGITINNQYILSRLSIKKKSNQPTTNKFFDEWENYLVIKSDEYSNGSLKSARTSLNHFTEFCCINHLFPSFDDITPDLLNDFRSYLLKVGQLNNTVLGTIKRMRFFLNHAYRMGKHKNILYREFKLKEYRGNVHFLTWEEVMKIYHFEKLSEYEKQVRDFFCFGCFTGLDSVILFSFGNRILKKRLSVSRRHSSQR